MLEYGNECKCCGEPDCDGRCCDDGQIDNTRECDQCGFRPWVGWDRERCPRHYDHSSCDGILVPVESVPCYRCKGSGAVMSDEGSLDCGCCNGTGRLGRKEACEMAGAEWEDFGLETLCSKQAFIESRVPR